MKGGIKKGKVNGRCYEDVKEELKDDEWWREGYKSIEGTWDEGVRITITVLLFNV